MIKLIIRYEQHNKVGYHRSSERVGLKQDLLSLYPRQQPNIYIAKMYVSVQLCTANLETVVLEMLS